MFERLENSYLILHFLLHNQNTTLNCPYASLIPLLFYKWLFLCSVTHSPRPLCAVRCFRCLQEISTWLFLQLIEVLPHWSGLFFFKSSMAVLLQVSFGRSLFFFPRGVHLSAILGSELGGGIVSVLFVWSVLLWSSQFFSTVLFGVIYAIYFMIHSYLFLINSKRRK